MKTLLIGNGFDLHHYLPTKYSNFINTVNYLITNYTGEMKTVGHVFGAHKLQEMDPSISDSYKIHHLIFHKTLLPMEKAVELINLGKDNKWFQFLSKGINESNGWIDFEKEIARVIDIFSNIPSDVVYSNILVLYETLSREMLYTICQFGIFERLKGGALSADERFFSERTPGAGVKYIDKNMIADFLFASLKELANMLKTYLECFIESSLNTMYNEKYLPENQKFGEADYVITFNYTNTCEKLYDIKGEIFHIHGITSDKIILGINPDECDELENIDTTFIEFKKYFQRIILHTDDEYINWREELNQNRKYNAERVLIIAGHSLDITDRDIIVEIFELATTITIYYHNPSIVGTYVKNLIRIFGKTYFDILRVKKNLKFIPYEEVIWG